MPWAIAIRERSRTIATPIPSHLFAFPEKRNPPYSPSRREERLSIDRESRGVAKVHDDSSGSGQLCRERVIRHSLMRLFSSKRQFQESSKASASRSRMTGQNPFRLRRILHPPRKCTKKGRKREKGGNSPRILVSCGSKGGNRGCVCCPGFFSRTPTTCGGGIIILAASSRCFTSVGVARHIADRLRAGRGR